MSTTASGRTRAGQQPLEADELGGLHTRIRGAADSARSTPLPDLPFSAYRRFDDGDRLAYEELYFRRRAHVTALAAEALIDPEAPLDALADALWSICDEYTWALPAHETRHAGRRPAVREAASRPACVGRSNVPSGQRQPTLDADARPQGRGGTCRTT